MRRIVCLLCLVFGLVGVTPARAAYEDEGAGAFIVTIERHAPLRPRAALRAFTRVERWWSGAHTYSGSAANLSLKARPGGCWCERLADGSDFDHMSVASYRAGRHIELNGALGPLRGMGANGVMRVTVSGEGDGAKVVLVYEVVASPGVDFSETGPAVDGVLMEQMDRFVAFASAVRQ